jgi:predicted glutamine amidotransferase
MCGLVGVAGNITRDVKAVFTLMLELDTVRGAHSTGIASVTKGDQVAVMKELGTPWDLRMYKQYDGFMAGLMHEVLIGHNRYATKGKINRISAHPFEKDHIVGAHNGTLRNQHLLDDTHLFDVDSENIFHHMAINGVEDTIDNLDGSFALTWYNTEDKTLNLIRNDERPLYYAYTEDSRTLLWASEPWIIRVAASKGQLKLHEIKSLKEMELFTTEVHTKANQTMPNPTVRQYEEYVPPVKKQQAPLQQRSNTHGGRSSEGKGVRVKHSEYADLVMKSIPVCFDKGMTDTLTNQFYIKGNHVNNWMQEVRVYVDNTYKNQNKIKEIIGKTHPYLVYINRLRLSPQDTLLIADGISKVLPIGWSDVSITKGQPRPKPKPLEFRGFDGQIITKAKWLEQTKNNCAWCASPAVAHEPRSVLFIDKDEFVCMDCAKNPEVQEMLPDNVSVLIGE